MLISEVITELVDSLQAVDINATAEPADLELPGALVLSGDIEFAYLGAESFDMDFEIYLVCPAHKTQADVMDDLQDLLNKFRSVYPIKDAQPIALPRNTGSPIPGLLITLPVTITKD